MAQESPDPKTQATAWFVLMLLLGVILPIAAVAEIEDEDYARLETAYAAIGGDTADGGGEAAETPQSAMGQALRAETHTTRDWHEFFHRYYAGHILPAAHTSFWSALIQENPESAEALGNLTAVAAIEALAARLAQSPPDIDSARLAMGWLAQMAAALSGPQLQAVGTIVQDALRGDALDLEPLLTIAP
ncbi:MAG: hypothetical protein IT368_17305, partial [Candidatus Hydrogenedentes bacterium]|nr:hypothetical protein [Candidatus Hydrogenedentota bacterium]